MKTKHRAKLARERAGLSVGQACKFLKIAREELTRIEESDAAFADADIDVRDLMCDIYAVNRTWLQGLVPQHAYTIVDKIPGADKLLFKDRDTIAEVFASKHRR